MQVVLIGPMRAGKSTLGELLAGRLGIRNVPLDLVRWGYYYLNGYDRATERALVEREGYFARFKYWKPFEIDAVERVLRDYPEAVIDFGAGHSDYQELEHVARAQAALASTDHVILLLPSSDPEASVRCLLHRLAPERDEETDVRALLNGFVRSSSNVLLATTTVYTDGRTPDDTCDELMELIGQ